MIVEEITKNLKDAAAFASVPDAERRIDPALLTRGELERPHQSIVTTCGRRIHVSLPEGQYLKDGDVLAEEDGVIVMVQASEEDVLLVRPKSDRELALVCYNTGNMHAALYLDGEDLLIPYDPVIETILAKITAAYERRRRPILGDSAKASAGARHGHVHHHEDTYTR
ncbi:MAG: urease accessory protein UreE [Clostridiales Family XIII bacterium]|jgi:urease accessory protein|nr:urease accessory protein UreE [Clostridiales Family XIII bacterium]